jgi:hypothetical protein
LKAIDGRIYIKDIIYDSVFKKFNKDIDLEKNDNDIKHAFMKHFNVINNYLDYEKKQVADEYLEFEIRNEIDFVSG